MAVAVDGLAGGEVSVGCLARLKNNRSSDEIPTRRREELEGGARVRATQGDK
jgi:hypothetical protein